MNETARVFIVDDDPSVRRALERLLAARGYGVEAFDSAQAFLARPPHEGSACVVLDLKMPGLSGLDLQDLLARAGRAMAIVFLSGTADVRSAAKAMRGGAVDFLVKPVEEAPLMDAVASALARDTARRTAADAQRALAARLERLTRREFEVCEFVARGLLNKQIAAEIGTSIKTVKTHRGRAMHKLEVDSVAALVRLLARHANRPSAA